MANEACKLCGQPVGVNEGVFLTKEEASTLAGLAVSWINEMGSIYNDYDRIGEENRLRAKLSIQLIEGEPGVGNANLAQSGMTDDELAEVTIPRVKCNLCPGGYSLPGCDHGAGW